MLSLGFPAHDRLERVVQSAMHKYHLVLAQTLIITLIITTTLPAVLLYVWLGAQGASLFLAVCATLVPFLLLVCIADYFFWGSASLPDDLLRHEELSRESAVLCNASGIPATSVFVDPRGESKAEAINLSGTRAILVSPDIEGLPFVERQGILAHELGHHLLPFDQVASVFISGRQVYHAREYAADAIAVNILGDVRPILFSLHRFMLKEVALGIPMSLVTHPPLVTRIDRLLDLNFIVAHTRTKKTR